MTVSSERLKDVSEKVKKLLALSESSNIEEASLAAQKAKEILLKYNMTMTDVELATQEYGESVFDTFKRQDESFRYFGEPYVNIPRYIQRLTFSMIKYFYVRVLFSKGGGRTVVKFFGAKTDVEVAVYVFNYLIKQIEILSNEFVRKQYGAGNSKTRQMRLSYQIGCIEGIEDTLKKQQESTEHIKTSSGTDLIPLKKAELDKHFRDMYKNKRLSSHTMDTSIRSTAAFDYGFETGKNIKIHRGVSSGSSEQRRIS